MLLKVYFKQNNMLLTTSHGSIGRENISRIETQSYLLLNKWFFADGTCLDIYWSFPSPACFVFDFSRRFLFLSNLVKFVWSIVGIKFSLFAQGGFIIFYLLQNKEKSQDSVTISNNREWKPNAVERRVRWGKIKQETSGILF